MNPDAIAQQAIDALRDELDAAKFTPAEWADIDMAVKELATLAVLIPTASDAALKIYERRLKLMRSILRNYATAKAIEVEGVVVRTLRRYFDQALRVGLDTLEKVLVKA